jgi:L-ascorbate metabolism protein UlaG (beta-lactamase superfamily)
MQIEWYGQSAFRLAAGDTTVVIDPFGDLSDLKERGIRFDYPPIPAVTADVVLVTHEHSDHNGIEVVAGDPFVLRSTAGILSSPIGEVAAIASEHDEVAGTQRGQNTIFVFGLDGIRVAHFGDFGQRALRDEQAAAIGATDIVFLPIGGGPTIDAAQAAAIVERLGPRWVVPMHYRTARLDFLDDAEPFLSRMAHVERLEVPHFDTAALAATEARPLVVLLQAP